MLPLGRCQESEASLPSRILYIFFVWVTLAFIIREFAHHVFRVEGNKLEGPPRAARGHLHFVAANSLTVEVKTKHSSPILINTNLLCKPGSLPNYTTHSVTSVCSLAGMYPASWPGPLVWLLQWIWQGLNPKPVSLYAELLRKEESLFWVLLL